MRRVLAVGLALAFALAPPAARAETFETSEPIVIRAAAVSETDEGLLGSTATITITSSANGSGHVFLDTFPLTQVDMQGSARLASRVAAQITGHAVNEHDFFFVVRSNSQQIGGPSAGAAMAVGAAAALNGWNVRDDALMTGTINPDGTVGPVGGIAEKATAAAAVGITRFLFPAGQEIVPFGDARVVNMTAYCRDELKIDCVPVVDVVEAVGLMTDHVIERPPLTGDVTGEEFLARLGPLGGELVDDAQRLVDEAQVALDSLPAGAAKTGLTDALAGARTKLEEARGHVVNRSYYTAASTSFQASIEAHYVREASEVLAAEDTTAASIASLQEARSIVEGVRVQVERARVEDTNGFEAVGAAQVRLLEAEQRIETASAILANPASSENFFTGLHEAAHAAQRAETAEWWLQLTEGFPAGEPVEADALEQTARDTIITSTEEVAYVEAVFMSAGLAGGVETSRDLLESANEALSRGFYAGAMLNALEASVRASVALEITSFGGNVPDSKLETAREYAARAIQGARARGVESLLAQSAYEFGLSLPNDADRLSFLGVARVTGNLAGLPGLFDEARPPASRFQSNPPPLRVDAVYVAAAFAVGIALGIGSGLAAMMPRKPEDDEPLLPAQTLREGTEVPK